MKTPEEWLNEYYYGCQKGVGCSAFSWVELQASDAMQLFKKIQDDAFHAGQLAGVEIGRQTAMKVIDEVFKKPAETTKD